VTARDFVGTFYRPPVRAKGYDTFLPAGPRVAEGEIQDPHGLVLRTYVNGKPQQEGNTARMLHRADELAAFVSSVMTLEPDDLILTGTPRGIAPVRPEDAMRFGDRRNRCAGKPRRLRGRTPREADVRLHP